ncbi:MAG: L,D-transpeptidase family protein [Muribaculaceae bacterium]|nr:L,D-transpeptidase family protein [Muribaculaceae bacterium]
MKFHIVSILITFFSFSFLTSCKGSSQTEYNPYDSILNDTVHDENILVKSSTDSLSINCSAEEAIEYMKISDDWDKYAEGILPNLVEQHLPYAQRLINNNYDNFIIVDKNTMMVILYDKFGRRKLNFKMACGRNYGHKQKKADCRTPEGYFLCGGRFDSTDWLYTDDYGYTSPIKGQFGPRFIRVTTQIGIHGTNARYSIGRRCSHGCIRIQNEEILYLYKFAKKGMPIIVNPGKKDVETNQKAQIDKPALILPDSIITNPDEFFEFKKAYFKEKAQKDSIERAEREKAIRDSINAIRIVETNIDSTNIDVTKASSTESILIDENRDTTVVKQ